MLLIFGKRTTVDYRQHCPYRVLYRTRDSMNKSSGVAKSVRYEKPALVAHGTIEQITKGGVVGNKLDASFPVGTPQSGLTFS